jgi:hypothetical protein
MECKYDGCNQLAKSRGFCQKHYKRLMKHGNSDPRKNSHEPLVVRFWMFVDKKEADDCWNWTGNIQSNGYGRFSVGSKEDGSDGAHRVSWRLANNQDIPKGMHIMHKCDNPSCVNPNHLTIGTAKQNTQDMIRKGRKKTIAPLGTENGKSLLDAEKVLLIRSSNLNHAALGRQLGVSPNCVRGVRIGRTWSHIK